MATNPKPAMHAPWGEYVPNVGAMTVQEFEHFPEEADWIYELHQGRLVRMPGPGYDHGAIQSRLSWLVNSYLLAHQTGILIGTGCHVFSMAPKRHEVLCPDLSYVLPARMQGARFQGSYPVVTPDLVIEIVSPSDTRPEVLEKVKVYLAAGVPLIWIAWPAKQIIDVWRAGSDTPLASLGVNDMLDGLDVIPGFTAPVQDIFGVA